MNAIETITADPALHTRDLGGSATTAQVTDAVCAQLAAASRSGLPSRESARLESAAIEARVIRKITWRILPFVMLLYFVSFLDRVNVASPR